MFCYKCGEENPDEAKYCKNCGVQLRKEETVRKVEVVEAPNHQQNNNQQQNTQTANTSSNNSNSSAWIGCCCLGIIIVFILSAILSGA